MTPSQDGDFAKDFVCPYYKQKFENVKYFVVLTMDDMGLVSRDLPS